MPLSSPAPSQTHPKATAVLCLPLVASPVTVQVHCSIATQRHAGQEYWRLAWKVTGHPTEPLLSRAAQISDGLPAFGSMFLLDCHLHRQIARHSKALSMVP